MQKFKSHEIVEAAKIVDIAYSSELARAKMHYRALASENHPDKGGDSARMAEINRAWEQAQEDLGNG